jgi:hypothetical protein
LELRNFYGGASDASLPESPMMDVDGCDLIFRRATMVTVCAWMCLVASVYAITFRRVGIFTQGTSSSWCGVCTRGVSFFILIHPSDCQIHATRPSQSNLRFSNKWSGILRRSRFNASPFHQRALGMGANGLVDPIREPESFTRWCECRWQDS